MLNGQPLPIVSFNTPAFWPHFVSGADPWSYLFPIAHTHPFIGGVYVPFEVYEICTTLKMSDHQP